MHIWKPKGQLEIQPSGYLNVLVLMIFSSRSFDKMKTDYSGVKCRLTKECKSD